MGLSVNSNPLAYSVARNLSKINDSLKETSERISTGKRILTPKDDPAGIGILTSLKGQYSSWNSVEKNLNGGTSILDVSAGALDNQGELLIKMKDIATQASSDLISTDQRDALQKTFTEMQDQLDTIVNRASIFGQNLVSASGADVNVQTGISAGDTKTLTAIKSDGATLGVDSATIDLTDSSKASAAMTALDDAIKKVAVNKSVIGAQQTGFDSLTSIASTSKSNLEKAMSRIEDADVAEETTKLQLLQTKQQLSIQALGIIQSLPTSLLSLLR